MVPVKKIPLIGDLFHIWYNEIWVQKKKYHSLGICLIFGTMKSESRNKIPLIGDLSHIWYNEIWVQKKKYHSLVICLIFETGFAVNSNMGLEKIYQKITKYSSLVICVIFDTLKSFTEIIIDSKIFNIWAPYLFCK